MEPAAPDLLLHHRSLVETAPGVFERDADRTWWGGGALFGGYAQVLALEAMRRCVPDPAKVPKSITMHYLRPFVDGPQRIEVVLEREGRNMANATARLFSGGKLAGLALANFGTNRPSGAFRAAALPAAATPVGPDEQPHRPTFAIPTHDLFDCFPRIVGGPGAPVAETGAWIRPRFPAPADEFLCTVLADLWLPVIWARAIGASGAVSADIAVHFRVPMPVAGVAPGDPLFVHLTAPRTGDGWAEEDGRIWTQAGELVAESRQTRFVHV
jgi:acyl-CoA thioesterase